MSSEDSSSSTEFQECILKCKDAKQLYNFPTKNVMRNVWLYKLGLDDDDFYPNPRVCDKHFSEKMFESNKKLKSIAVPDITLPTELLPKNVAKVEIKTVPPIPPGPKRKKPVKIVEISSLESNPSPPQRNSPPMTTDTNTQPIVNSSPAQSWINESSGILVDYQLKVGGKHLCNVIEIPECIVVFTVIKAKQTKLIQLSDIKNKAITPKRSGLKNLPKPTAYITIDDDTDETHESGRTQKVQTKPLEIVKPAVKYYDKLKPASDTRPLKIVKPNFGTKNLKTVPPKPKRVRKKRPKIKQPELPAAQTKTLEIVKLKVQPLQIKPTEIVEPEDLGVTASKSPSLEVKPEKEPEIDIVYYTTDEAPPRRDRAVQVDLSNKLCETGIQCDVQLDNDMKEMSYNSELYWLQSRCNIRNPLISMDECLVCGEILTNYASKVSHAYLHETSPSLCSQCGDIFENRIKLKIHEQNVHFNPLDSMKPQRCPKTNCNKAFRSKKQLNDHIEEHVKTKAHKCNKCLQFFSSSMKLSCHQRALDKCLRTRGWTSRRWSKRI